MKNHIYLTPSIHSSTLRIEFAVRRNRNKREAGIVWKSIPVHKTEFHKQTHNTHMDIHIEYKSKYREKNIQIQIEVVGWLPHSLPTRFYFAFFWFFLFPTRRQNDFWLMNSPLLYLFLFWLMLFFICCWCCCCCCCCLYY